MCKDSKKLKYVYFLRLFRAMLPYGYNWYFVNNEVHMKKNPQNVFSGP